MTGNALQRLAALGQSVWYDNIHRDLLRDGTLAEMVDRDALAGVTSNPTIFHKAISAGGTYDDALAAALRGGERDPEALFTRLAVADIAAAADLLAPVHRASGGADGFVSLEVDPRLADDSEATVAEAERLFAAVGRPNVMVKVPGTRAGLPAIERLIAAGVNVNVTLLFSVARYREVVEAYLRGLERRRREGRPLEGIASVASFFVSRIDTKVDAALAERPPELAEALAGRAAIANAALAYAHYRTVFHGEAFAALAAAGARPQRLLWASTGTKNPRYSETLYVDGLVAEETVTTLPPATYEAYRERGAPRLRLGPDASEAEAVVRRLGEEAGIDLDAVTSELEVEGVQAFVDSYEALLAAIEAKAGEVAGRQAAG